MKLWLTRTANNKLWPVDELAEGKIKKIPVGVELEYTVNTKQNGKLHRKIFGFFKFCTVHYYGDIEAGNDDYQLEFVRKKLTVIAGYHKQVFQRNGVDFELVPLSLSYDKMSPEERGEFYKRIIDAALKRVFDRTTDQNIINQLVSWF